MVFIFDSQPLYAKCYTGTFWCWHVRTITTYWLNGMRLQSVILSTEIHVDKTNIKCPLNCVCWENSRNRYFLRVVAVCMFSEVIRVSDIRTKLYRLNFFCVVNFFVLVVMVFGLSLPAIIHIVSKTLPAIAMILVGNFIKLTIYVLKYQILLVYASPCTMLSCNYIMPPGAPFTNMV